jgi:hypothetical protein
MTVNSAAPLTSAEGSVRASSAITGSVQRQVPAAALLCQLLCESGLAHLTGTVEQHHARVGECRIQFAKDIPLVHGCSIAIAWR